ncbi:unnamed protein product [Knipowitschia caucasica]
MTSAPLSLIVMLLASVNGQRNDNEVQLCAEVQASRSVVVLGSAVWASCTTTEHCPVPIAPSLPMGWHLNGALLPHGSVTSDGNRTSTVVIANFSRPMASLTCSVLTSPPQIVGGVQIRAGYLPSVPQSLQCQTNLTQPLSMLCSWDPGRSSLLPTKYSLHTHVIDLKRRFCYKLPPGQHHFRIPRSDLVLFSDMEVYVEAQNELGKTASATLVVEPISTAKFHPPEILQLLPVPKKPGCLSIHWNISKHEAWLKDVMNVEVKLEAVDNGQRRDLCIFEKRARPSKVIEPCRLLHGTRYVGQMRVRYRQSPWSEWSSSHSGVTLESAPSGRFDSWMKVSRDHTHKQVGVHLFWKPSKQFRANGQNVSYVVYGVKEPGERAQLLCQTVHRHCTFWAAWQSRVYLRAANGAGRSQPTYIRIYNNKEYAAVTDLTVTPHDSSSLVVQWTCDITPPLLGFVVEWIPLLQTDLVHLHFQTTEKNQTSFVISGDIEPYKPYGISVYPRFKDGLGLLRTTNAFSRQKAPSMVPELVIEKTWQFDVEMTWDEIPLDQRNGIIQGFRVFYREGDGPLNVVEAKPDERRVLLHDLNPMCVYEAFLMASTLGGSRNGSIIHFKTESFDVVYVVIIVSCIMGMLIIAVIVVAQVASRHERFKNHFCPIIPDPANSSVKEWSTDSLEEIPPSFTGKVPSLLYLCRLSFMDLPTKICKEEEEEEEEDEGWVNKAEDTSDLGESICGSPFLPGYCGSNNDSVPYATVIFPCPCTSPCTGPCISPCTGPCISPCTSPAPSDSAPHTYLRSDSTQPLLEAEEAFTPKCYQNVCDQSQDEQRFFGSEETEPETDLGWNQFPFLRALEIPDLI